MAKMSKAKQRILKDNLEKDLVSAGFRRLDKSLVSLKPPKIKWGKLYKEFNEKEKIEYLENLCSTMNNAAFLIQEERNGLLALIDKKNDAIDKAKEDMEKNIDMVHKELGKVNEERQKFNSIRTAMKGDDIKKYLRSLQS